MARFKTCIGCASIGTCAKLSDLKKRIEGMRVSIIKHTCKERVSDLQPGDPILVLTVATGEWVDRGPDDGYVAKGLFRGHFIQETSDPNKVIVFVAPGTEPESTGPAFKPKNDGFGFVKASRSRVKRLINGYPANATPCPRCGELAGITGKCYNFSHGYYLSPSTEKCMLQPSEEIKAAQYA